MSIAVGKIRIINLEDHSGAEGSPFSKLSSYLFQNGYCLHGLGKVGNRHILEFTIQAQGLASANRAVATATHNLSQLAEAWDMPLECRWTMGKSPTDILGPNFTLDLNKWRDRAVEKMLAAEAEREKVKPDPDPENTLLIGGVSLSLPSENRCEPSLKQCTPPKP